MQGKDELIGSLVPGRVLYIKYEEYMAKRITFCGPWQPETVIGEGWWEVRADGLFNGVDVVWGSEGELLTYIESAGKESESVDVATGQRMYYPFVAGSAKDIAGWIESVWELPVSIEEGGYEFRGRSELNGRDSLVYEETLVDWDGEKSVRGMEFVEKKPILFRSSIYDVGEGEERTLVDQHTFLEYRVLPEGAVMPTFEVPPPTHPVDPEECPDMDMRPSHEGGNGLDGVGWVGRRWREVA